MSRIVDIADAIETKLNAATFTYSASTIVIQRSWLPYINRATIGDGVNASDKTARISVVPNQEVVQEKTTRSSATHEFQVDLFVQRAIDWTDNAMVDETVDLAEEVFSEIASEANIDVGSITAKQLFTNFEPVVVAEHLLDDRLYTARVLTRWWMIF